jgi:hypothetical protein
MAEVESSISLCYVLFGAQIFEQELLYIIL